MIDTLQNFAQGALYFMAGVACIAGAILAMGLALYFARLMWKDSK